MKQRLIISIIIFIVLIMLSTVSQILIGSRIEKLSQQFDKVYTKVATQTIPHDECKTLINEWDRSKTLFHVFLFHGSISELEKHIDTIKKLTEKSDITHLKHVCIDCISLLNETRDSIKVSLENVF